MSDKNDLLILLKAESPRTASDLAKILDVTSRTIYRWVEKLIDEGHPIYSTTGRSGGIGLDLDGSIIAALNAERNSEETAEKESKKSKESNKKSDKAKISSRKAEKSISDDEDFGEITKENDVAEIIAQKTKTDINVDTDKQDKQNEIKDDTKEKIREELAPKVSFVKSEMINDDRLSDAGSVYADWLEVDFSQEEIDCKIDKKYVVCKEAIFTRHILNFTYHLPQGKMLICSTEPVKFFLHDGQWHILAWVRQVERFKVFQLLNMTDLMIGPEKHNRIADFSIQQAMKK